MVVVNRLEKKSVSGFISQYNNKSTRKAYRSSLRKFFSMVYPELKETYPQKGSRKEMSEAFKIFDPRMDELSLEYIQGEAEIEGDVLSFRKLLEGSAPKSMASSMAIVFKYLASNDLEFTKDWKKNIVGKVSQKGISRERVPTPDELSRILYNLPPQGRTIVRVIATAGMRPDEGLTLKLSDLELDFVAHYMGLDRQMKSVPISKINIRAENSKTGEARMTFITGETRAELDEWLNQARKIYIEKLKSQAHINPDESLVFPFSYDTLRGIWIVALKKSGLYSVDPQTNRVLLRLHNLRKFFRTWGGWRNPDVAEALMGHQKGLTAIYSRQDQALRLLVDGFKEAEVNLTLGGHVIIGAPTKEMKALEDWNKQLEAGKEKNEKDIFELRLKVLESDKEMRELGEDNKKLNRDVEDLKEMVMGLNALVTALDEQMNEFRDSYQTE